MKIFALLALFFSLHSFADTASLTPGVYATKENYCGYDLQVTVEEDKTVLRMVTVLNAYTRRACEDLGIEYFICDEPSSCIHRTSGKRALIITGPEEFVFDSTVFFRTNQKEVSRRRDVRFPGSFP